LTKSTIMIRCLAVFLMAHGSWACDVCATHVALSDKESVGRPSVSIFEQLSKFEPSGGEDDTFETWTTQFAVGYRLSERWAVQLGIPYADRELNGDTEQGLGDATALAAFRAFQRIQGANVALVDAYAGLEMPTGDSDLLREERDHALEEETMADMPGVPHEHPTGHHLALGSGSWDGIFGVNAYGKYGRWAAQGNAQYKLNTEGDFDFEYGDEFVWLTGVKYFAVLEHAQSLAAGVDLSGNWQDQNKVLGETDTDHPSTRATYVGPAATYTHGDRLNISVAWDFPIAGEDNGLEGAADTHVRASASWQF
jgi:hypothetical protein